MHEHPPHLSTAQTLKQIAVYFLLFLAGDFLSSIPFDLLFSVVALPAPWMYQLPRTLGSLLLTYFLFWIYTVKVLHLQMSDFRISRSIKKWAVLYSILLPAFVVIAFLVIGEGSVRRAAPGTAWGAVVNSFVLAIKAGLLEEMLFRGYIMKLVESRWTTSAAIVVPSFLFSLAHIPQMETFSWTGVVLLLLSGTLVGIMFSLAAYAGGSTGSSFLLHAVWNFVMVTDILYIGTGPAPRGDTLFSITIPDHVLLTGAGFGVEASIIAVIGYLAVCCLLFRRRRHAG